MTFITVKYWLIFLCGHLIVGTTLWYFFYRKLYKYLYYTNLAIIQLALKKELIAIKSYVIIGLPLAILFDLVIKQFK